MSLLLDALKRAEQEKIAGRGAEVRPVERATAPAAAPDAANSPLELQPIGAAAAGAALRNEAAARAAQVVFQAKIREPDGRNRGMLWATLGAIGVVVIAAGAYVWYSVRMLTPQLVAASPPRPRAAPMPPPASGTLPVPPGAELPASPVPSSLSPAAANAPSPPAARLRTVAPPGADEGDLVARIIREAARPPAPAPLKLARTNDAAPTVPAEVRRGYEDLRRGNLAEARRAYQAALAADPTSLDAQMGIATVEARTGNRTAASHHYRKVLERDPRNATALAALAGLGDLARPEAMEGRLRADVDRNPESAALQFALGNLHASQARWHEAQAAYFEAHRLEPGNADIAHNLAVSLDHLGKSRLAADFYARALESGKTQATQFDPAPVARRLAELRP